MNDLLFLHLHRGHDGNQPVAWQSLTPFISQIEAVASEAGVKIVEGYLRRPIMELREGVSGSRLLIAGPPRRGSIVLPFALELPAVLNIVGQSPMMMTPQQATSPLSEYIGTLADLAALTVLIRDVLFGQRGVVARRTDQEVKGPAITLEERAIDQAADQLLAALTPSIEKLLQAAEATGCDQLDVQINDQSRVQLIMADRRRRASLIARQRKPEVSSQMPLGYIFEPDMANELLRPSNVQLPVRYRDRELPAITLQVTSPTQQKIVALWAAGLAMPAMGEKVEVRGRRIARDEIAPLDDVPEEFESASDVFLVEMARASWT